jgi:hypothetical protein
MAWMIFKVCLIESPLDLPFYGIMTLEELQNQFYGFFSTLDKYIEYKFDL